MCWAQSYKSLSPQWSAAWWDDNTGESPQTEEALDNVGEDEDADEERHKYQSLALQT